MTPYDSNHLLICSIYSSTSVCKFLISLSHSSCYIDDLTDESSWAMHRQQRCVPSVAVHCLCASVWVLEAESCHACKCLSELQDTQLSHICLPDCSSLWVKRVKYFLKLLWWMLKLAKPTHFENACYRSYYEQCIHACSSIGNRTCYLRTEEHQWVKMS